MKSLIVVFAMAFVVGNANAQCRVQYSTTYVPQTQIAVPATIGVAVPVLVPAFQFQYQPAFRAAATAATAAQVVATPTVAAATVQRGNDQNSMRLMARMVVDELRRDADAMEDPGPPVAIDPYGSVPSRASATPRSKAPPQGSKTDSLAIQVLANRCAECHQGSRSKSRNAIIFTDDGQFNWSVNKASLARTVFETRTMPPSERPPLSEQDKASLRPFLLGLTGGIARK